MTAHTERQTVLPFEVLTVPLDPRVTLVEASAGTGKTFAITRLVLRLLLERKVDTLARILVVTFTEKAAQELVTRIRATLRMADRVWSDMPPVRTDHNEDLFQLKAIHGDSSRDIVTRALGSLDDLAVSTIHGFCQRILAESALESGIPFRTAFIEDDTEPFQRAARDWARVRLLTGSAEAQAIVNDGASIDSWVKCFVAPFRRQQDTRIEFDSASTAQQLIANFVTTVDRTFESEKSRRHLLCFDDLLRKLSNVLTAEGAHGALATRIRTKFGAALIDEFQDTDQTQFPIFSNAFAGCPLFLIGDPKQSIYRFRGADIHAYLTAARAAERKYTLLKNYRSTPAYVTAVERLFTRAPDPFLVSEEAIGFPRVVAADTPQPPHGLADDGRCAMEWWWLDGSLGAKGKFVAKAPALTLVVREVANEIVRLRAQGLPARSIAVLCRTNDETRIVKAALDRAGVPAVVAGDADVLACDEADELIRLASAIGAPQDGRALRSAMATRLWGSDATEIAAMLQEDGEPQWAALTARFAAARDVWRTRGVAAAFGELFADRGSAERLLALPDGERRLTNVRHIVELFHEAWAIDGMTPEAVAPWVAREQTVPNTPGRRELRLETDSEAVQILTIHKSKGLQFDVVFCPSLWQHYAERKGPLDVLTALVVQNGEPIFDIGSEKSGERRAQAQSEEKAEALRLAYVALTRAVHRCYVAWGNIGEGGSSDDSALGYLLRDQSGESARSVLTSLVASSGGTMGMRIVEKDELSRVFSIDATAISAAQARPISLAPGQRSSWAVSSFTGLTANAHSDDSRDIADPVMVTVETRPEATATGFRAFPAGAQAGVALHDIFERLDFRRAAELSARDMVVRSLAVHGLTGDATIAEQRANHVHAMLATVCNAPIPRAGFSLSDVPGKASLREWRFDLSVSTTSVQRIADALASYGSAHAKAYAPMLGALRESTLGGYLTGIVDLAFEHDGRWWIVDWKSNQLGENDNDYAPNALSTVMMNAHYTLQYHLYLVALHRHLRVRVPGYDPSIHWGGVAYVFLRGVTGQSDDGWFRDEPTPALLDALDQALGRRI